LIGRLNAAGLTIEAVEKEVRRRLADENYVREPKVTVSVDEYRSQRLFVMGEVRAPGAYPLTRETTLIEVLARAGSTTAEAAGVVVIMRPSTNASRNQPTTSNQGVAGPATEVLRIDLKELQTGQLQSNPALRDGDTVFVPRGERIYIFGHVRAPGAYALQRNMTVLEALAVAGGVTDRGATNRVRISRMVNGKKHEIGTKLTELVQPGDTLIVPERFF
jgi:polysaccharide export outer membrane protein